MDFEYTECITWAAYSGKIEIKATPARRLAGGEAATPIQAPAPVLHVCETATELPAKPNCQCAAQAAFLQGDARRQLGTILAYQHRMPAWADTGPLSPRPI